METNILPETPTPEQDASKLPSASIPDLNGTTPSTASASTSLRSSSSDLKPSGYPNPPTTIPITVHTSPLHTPIARFATINAAAGLTDPFALLASAERYGVPLDSITHDQLLGGNTDRIQQKLANGAVMVEAGDFAAVACWEPPICTARMEIDDGDLSFPSLAQRPVMHEFFKQAASWRRKAIRGRQYWHLTLMARDPLRRDVKGAVRSVLEAGIWWAKRDGVPIWLEAGNQRAQEVYAAFGFRELGVTWHGREGAKVPVWMMVWEPIASHIGEHR